MPLLRLRAAAAVIAGFPFRLGRPVLLRLMRFVYEIWGRSQIRGHVEPGVQFIGMITVEGTRNVHVGQGTRLGRRTFLKTDEAGRIEIGRNVTINDGATIVAYSGISIGDNTLVGEYVTIRDQNHGTRRGVEIRTQPYDSSPISIGVGAWLGRGVCVLKGVRIGEGAIVGANSVVTKDIEPYTVAGGVPARPIGDRKP